jgi:hypothetical protein
MASQRAAVVASPFDLPVEAFLDPSDSSPV